MDNKLYQPVCRHCGGVISEDVRKDFPNTELCEWCVVSGHRELKEIGSVRIPLMMGDVLERYSQHIKIGECRIDYGRPVTDKDIENVQLLYSIGAASRARAINHAMNMVFKLSEPVTIMGFKDPNIKEGDSPS